MAIEGSTTSHCFWKGSLRQTFGVVLSISSGYHSSATIIAREMSGSEVQEEMCKVITAIEYGTEINSHRDSAK